MDADIKGALNQIDRSWKCFEHNGKPMTKQQVKSVLEFGLSKGYDAVSEIKDSDIERIINDFKSE